MLVMNPNGVLNDVIGYNVVPRLSTIDNYELELFKV